MDKNLKKRNWGCVIYPESAPVDWLERLQLKGVAFAVSPLHDKDIDDEVSKTPKKPHYHVIMSYGSPTTFNNVNNIMKEFNQPIPIPLESVGGYYRYFTHKDNPDKYQYDVNDIRIFNGFDVCDVLNSFEVFSCMKEIQMFILEKDISEFSDLMDNLMLEDKMELWNVASTKTIFFNTYISSKRNKLKIETQKKQLVDCLK